MKPNRPLFILIIALAFSSASTVHAQTHKNINPYALGVGFDFEGSFGAVNYGIPIEFRFGKTTDPFTFHIGERFSFHNGGDDSSLYYDPLYGLWLHEPTISFTQFSTYFHARWNCWRDNEFTAFVGAGYYLNFNANARVNIDVPNISYINNQFVYTYGDGSRRFYCSDLVHPLSHSLRLEAGIEMPLFELTVFCSIDLTGNFKRNVVKNNIYYDPSLVYRDVTTYPVDGFSAINLATLEDINDATRDRVFIGVGLKFFLFSGYFK
ncbi:MAG: hypothetical protein AUK63_669 [bacterium P3]|nr:MAG: hypothetical protein AUK63_669 [bacterium P3]KWW42152.1 MAG: hypothetical protein F083_491 [bacterium F083]